MDFSKSFSFMFKDSSWRSKIFIGGLWNIASLFFIGYPFVLGYYFSVLQNTINGKEEILPDWSDLTDKFQKGFMIIIIYFSYTLPVIIITVFLDSTIGDTGAITLVLILLLIFWLPMVTINFARTGDFMSAYRVNEMINTIMNNTGIYIPMVLLSLAIISFSFFFGSLMFGIGIPFFTFWGITVSAHLAGQFGKYLGGADQKSQKVNV
ncbi:MAG: DUF4013 domain-containing protein [Candidatus Marinimicrobia bacterium]|nr:DUF4013 domain-containing protein [Candidatus Neomarinimicrobiota bacterium]MCH8304308.1 DUF4013 domain-containing protein [Candidatus Neomarinimicrobiota bacterium]